MRLLLWNIKLTSLLDTVLFNPSPPGTIPDEIKYLSYYRAAQIKLGLTKCLPSKQVSNCLSKFRWFRNTNTLRCFRHPRLPMIYWGKNIESVLPVSNDLDHTSQRMNTLTPLWCFLLRLLMATNERRISKYSW